VLTGVLIHLTKNLVRMVATDSYRLSVKETGIESSMSGSLQAIVPARTLLELSRIASAVNVDAITWCQRRTRCSSRWGGYSLSRGS